MGQARSAAQSKYNRGGMCPDHQNELQLTESRRENLDCTSESVLRTVTYDLIPLALKKDL